MNEIFTNVAIFANFEASRLAALFFLIVGAAAIVSRRLVFDIFRDDSPAQSPKRRVPWSVETAFLVFICGAILFPIAALAVVDAAPDHWFPDFSGAFSNEISDAPEAAPDGANKETNEEASAAPDGANKETNEETNAAATNKTNDDDLATQHPLARLFIRSRSTPWSGLVFALCFFVAVVAAPFAEEFLFRTLFQGTLENIALDAVLPPPNVRRGVVRPKDAPPLDDELFRWTDPTTPMERRSFRIRSFVAILVPALIFGLMHAGTPESPDNANSSAVLNNLYRSIVAASCANVATLVFGFFFLRKFAGATTGDVGLGPEFTYKAGLAFRSLRRFTLDFYRGIVAFVFVAPLVFALNGTLRALAPNTIVDPVPIFVFALFEGFVYWRTRRYATVVGMHVALNATSFFLLLCR